MRKRIESILQKRIIFIGGKDDKPPAIKNPQGIQLYTGCPNDLIEELLAALKEPYENHD